MHDETKISISASQSAAGADDARLAASKDGHVSLELPAADCEAARHGPDPMQEVHVDRLGQAAPGPYAEDSPASALSCGGQAGLQLRELSPEEAEELARCERIIHDNLEQAVKLHLALGIIRDKRLYRAQFKTFEAYCQARWEMPARSVRRLIDQAKVFEHLTQSPNDGRHASAWTVPASVSVVRPLISLPPEVQRQAWAEAVETAPGNRPTVKHVESVVRTFKERLGQAVEAEDSPASARSYGGQAGPQPAVIVKLPPAPSPALSRDQLIEVQVRRVMDEAEELMRLDGTADSAIGATVHSLVAALDRYNKHRERIRKIQKTRAA